jgi:hypothetical protein
VTLILSQYRSEGREKRVKKEGLEAPQRHSRIPF